MYVRIINNKSESTFECERCTIRPAMNATDITILLMDRNGVVHQVDYPPRDIEVIYMNNEGKTIDRKILSTLRLDNPVNVNSR